MAAEHIVIETLGKIIFCILLNIHHMKSISNAVCIAAH
jgi:hypothetical protein